MIASPHQWLTNHLGDCSARATISTNAHSFAAVNGRIMYLSASYSATISAVSGSPFQVAQPSVAQRRLTCATIARIWRRLMPRFSARGISQPPPSATSSRQSARAAISFHSTSDSCLQRSLSVAAAPSPLTHSTIRASTACFSSFLSGSDATHAASVLMYLASLAMRPSVTAAANQMGPA